MPALGESARSIPAPALLSSGPAALPGQHRQSRLPPPALPAAGNRHAAGSAAAVGRNQLLRRAGSKVTAVMDGAGVSVAGDSLPLYQWGTFKHQVKKKEVRGG